MPKSNCSLAALSVSTGCTGSGKTAIMQHKLKALDAETMCYASINLNSFSDAPALQTILEQSLEKKSGVSSLHVLTKQSMP